MLQALWALRRHGCVPAAAGSDGVCSGSSGSKRSTRSDRCVQQAEELAAGYPHGGILSCICCIPAATALDVRAAAPPWFWLSYTLQAGDEERVKEEQRATTSDADDEGKPVGYADGGGRRGDGICSGSKSWKAEGWPGPSPVHALTSHATCHASHADEEGGDGKKKMSKKQRKMLTQMKIAELKQMCERPDVVEVWDVTSADPGLLVFLKVGGCHRCCGTGLGPQSRAG